MTTQHVDDFWVIKAMILYGEGFVQALGEAARRADSDNLRQIKATWPEYWLEYTKHGENLRAEDLALLQLRRRFCWKGGNK